MPTKVLVVPDKFKGTLTARAAAEAIARGWSAVRPHDTLQLLPMSDGGDGFGAVMAGLLPAAEQVITTCNAAHKPLTGHWWWDDSSKTALIESAQIIGLALLPRRQNHPFALDTFGLGAVFTAAAAKGARSCLVGIGGSATNDGGFGLARALGWEFRDAKGHRIDRWTQLNSLASICFPDSAAASAIEYIRGQKNQYAPRTAALQTASPRSLFGDLVIAMDVQNPLLGPTGASRIYGPQKGLRAEDFPLAESCLERLARIVKKDLQIDCAAEPGAGAAGGLGFGLRAFLGGRFEPGFGVFARLAKLEERLRSADLVITGEGAIDRSSLMGKGVGAIAELCFQYEIPCFGLAGFLDKAALAEFAKPFFALAAGLCPDLTTMDQAQAQAAFWLQKLAAEAARKWTKKAQP